MQYLLQGWNCRMPGKYKDMILDIGTEELAHIEMLSVMIGKLLQGAPSHVQEREMTGNPALAAVYGGMDPQHDIVAGLGAGSPTAGATPGTPATSCPAATSWPTSGPTSMPSHRDACRWRGCLA
jgi:manganese catalase